MASPRWSRRRWITSAGVVALAALAGSLGALRVGGYALAPDVASKLEVFTPAHYLVVNALAERVLAPNTCDAARFADGYVARLPRKDRRDLLRFILYVEHFAPLGAGHIARFTSLDAGARDRVLAALEHSDTPLIHAGFRALRDLVFMAFYRDPSSWHAIGYPGPRIRWGEQ